MNRPLIHFQNIDILLAIRGRGRDNHIIEGTIQGNSIIGAKIGVQIQKHIIQP